MPLEMSDGAPALRLDLVNACLWRGPQALPLRPKTLEVLRCLVATPGQVVSKAALLDSVWPATAVSDVVLMVCIPWALESDAGPQPADHPCGA